MVRSPGSFILSLFILGPLRLLAQESDHLGSYHSLYFEIPVAEKWSFFNEDELRGIKLFNKYYYYELKGGFTYKYSKRLTLTLALGVYNTFHGGQDFENQEKKTDYRLWQQINYKQPLFSGVAEHRVRLEEVINDHFRPSVRYRLQPKWPLNKKELTKDALFATAYDELFLQFDSPLLSRNRIFGGFGYYFSKEISMQAGILRQTDFKSGGKNFAKNFFYVAGSFRM